MHTDWIQTCRLDYLAWSVSDEVAQLEEQVTHSDILVCSSPEPVTQLPRSVIVLTSFSRSINWIFGRDTSRF